MPTVFREAGFRFYFYSSDRVEPLHIHVTKNGNVAKFWLHNHRLQLAMNNGFSIRELAEIVSLLTTERRTQIAQAWQQHFNS